MGKFYTTHRPVRYPTGVDIGEKLTRRFSAVVPPGTRFIGLDGDKLHFLVPHYLERDTTQDVTFKFQTVREYGYAEAKNIDNLRFISRLPNGVNLFEEVG